MTKRIETYSLPSEFAEAVGLAYASITSDKHKKSSGQFFTPKLIADFMGRLAQPKGSRISILDPGCGTAILSCSLIEHLAENATLEDVNLTLYETDINVVKETEKVVAFLKDWLQAKGISFSAKIVTEDFVLSNKSFFTPDSLFGNQEGERFDYVISNPPYFKISKADSRAVVANELVYGQPNIYSIFMGLSAKLLTTNGELIFIVPRSFAAGNYFKAFRQSFFNHVSIANIHIFESRTKMFKNDNVLQENIIIRATNEHNAKIKITVSECEQDLSAPNATLFDAEELIDFKSKDKVLFIPSNTKEASTINIFKNWRSTLNDYNIQISTGPVVAFRCTDFLKETFSAEDKYVPLFWLHNIKEMEFVYPLRKGSKPAYILNSDKSQKVLLKNKNYVLIRRFSSKEEKSRLVCSPYFSVCCDADMIGIENHINYIYRPNGYLSEEEVWGISALFSSNLFDTYFRTFNGNTQVGASELKQIKMPPLDKIIHIGGMLKAMAMPQKVDVDRIVNEVLLEAAYV